MSRVDVDRTIDWILEEYELTQTQLGDALGVSQSTVSDWKRGKTKPDRLTLHVFGCAHCRDHFFVDRKGQQL